MKRKYISNREANILTLSASGARMVRLISEKPPTGWTVSQVWVDARGKYPRYKKYKLVKVNKK